MGQLAATAAGDMLDGRDAADYWYEKHENLLQEKLRIEKNMIDMEQRITSTVGKESQMLNEK